MRQAGWRTSHSACNVRLNPPEPGFDGPRYPPRRGPSHVRSPVPAGGGHRNTSVARDSTIGTIPRQTNAGRKHRPSGAIATTPGGPGPGQARRRER